MLIIVSLKFSSETKMIGHTCSILYCRIGLYEIQYFSIKLILWVHKNHLDMGGPDRSHNI